MRKSHTLFLTALAATLLCGTAVAQDLSPQSRLRRPSGITERNMEQLQQRYPLFGHNIQPGRQLVSGKVDARTAGMTRRRVPVASGSEIWVNVVYAPGMSQATDRSISSTTPGEPSAFTELIGGNFQFVNGVGLSDGILYGGYNQQLADNQGYLPLITRIDADSWTLQGTDSKSDFSLMALETAIAADGTTYGEFYSADGQKREFGVIDYAKGTRTTFGTTSKNYLALGVTNDGRLFGIAADGNLYRISTEDGSETLVGATGLTLTSSSGGYYQQTGEIDPRDNTFYWYATDVTTATTGFYTVDLTTGKATLQKEMGQYLMAGMIIPPPAAQPGAPAAAFGLETDFSGGSTTGTVSFATPSTTYSGDALTGALTYEVKCGAQVVASGNTTAGSYVQAPVTLPEGMQTVSVTTANAAGTSPKVKTTFWVGYDDPQPVSDLGLSIDPESGTVDLYWYRPESTVHGGYLGSLTFDVYRISGGKTELIEEGLEDEYFTETLPVGKPKSYAYGVVARNGNHTSQMATTDAVTVGTAFTIPYLETFGTQSDYDLWTNVDVNDDARETSFGRTGTWSYDAQEQCASYLFGNTQADDWLISPKISLKAGKSYVVSFKAKPRVSSSGTVFPERFEVRMGQGSNYYDMTQPVIDTTDVTTAGYRTYSNEVTVAEDGNYNLGIHALSTPDGWVLYVDSVSIEQQVSATAPDSVTALTVTPGADAELRAEVSFTAPTKTVSQEPLTGSISSIKVTRNGVLAKEFTDVAPGASVSFTDSVGVENGTALYVVQPFSGDDPGQKAQRSVYIGVDVPAAVSGITATDGDSIVALSWNKVGTVGAHGGLVKPELVDYQVMSTAVYPDGNRYLYGVLATARDADHLNLPYDTDAGEQGLEYWAVRAANAGGEGEAHMVSLLVGKPYALPFREGMAGARFSHYWDFVSTGAATALFSGDDTDGDGYSLTMGSQYEYEEGELYSGKIAISGAGNPVLTFNAKSNNSDNTLGIYIATPDGREQMVDMMAPGDSYRTYSVNLKQFASERYIRLVIIGSFNSPGEFTFDDIRVTDLKDQNLQVQGLSVPTAVTAGKSAPVSFVVKNFGAKPAKDFTVTLTAGDEVLHSEHVDMPLESMDQLEIADTIVTTVFSETGDLPVCARIDFAADEDTSDNVAADTVKVVAPVEAAPRNLMAESAAAGEVSLTWEAPDQPMTSYTETFDDTATFPPFSVGGITGADHNGSLGDWTLYDGDGQTTLMWNLDYQNRGVAHAWQVLDPSQVFSPLYDNDKAHSGAQELISFCPNVGASDDWLISPELTGKAQTISYYVRCLSLAYGDETFEVYYSTGGKAITDFVKLDDPALPTTEWEQRTADLPEGTKYFAIRHTANNIFGLLLDDISYSVPGEMPVSYNVYVDGKLAGSTAADGQLAYTAKEPDGTGEHRYSVTAVYAGGAESLPVTVTLSATGISGIRLSAGSPADIYTPDGKLVRRQAATLQGLAPGVYVVSGKKVIVK